MCRCSLFSPPLLVSSGGRRFPFNLLPDHFLTTPPPGELLHPVTGGRLPDVSFRGFTLFLPFFLPSFFFSFYFSFILRCSSWQLRSLPAVQYQRLSPFRSESMFVPNRFSSHYWKPSSSFQQGFKAVDVKIEQKVFTLRLGSGGSSICWSERTRNASYLLEVDREGASWIVSKLKDFIHRPSSCPNFSRFRGNVEVLTIQRINNKRGSFLEVSKLVQSGRKQTILLPSGQNARGWKKISHMLYSLLACFSEEVSAYIHSPYCSRQSQLSKQAWQKF